MPYPFPDPAVTPEFEAENGITYVWGGDKWVVKTFTSPTNYITPAVADTEYVRIDGTSTMAGDLQFSGNRSVKSDGIMKVDGNVAELAQGGTACVIIDGNVTTFRNRDVYFVADVFFQQGVVIGGKAVATENYVQNYALAKSGNITISGTTTFTNQTPISFEHSGGQSILTKGDLLFYGLKADNTRPSWEACRVGIDPTNENFSAFSTGKRFYWSGTYAYLNGSVRNYLNTATWDFRNNETDNNIVLSIDSAKAEYNGAVTTPKSIATKEYVDAIKTAAAAAADFAEFKTLIAAL